MLPCFDGLFARRLCCYYTTFSTWCSLSARRYSPKQFQWKLAKPPQRLHLTQFPVELFVRRQCRRPFSTLLSLHSEGSFIAQIELSPCSQSAWRTPSDVALNLFRKIAALQDFVRRFLKTPEGDGFIIDRAKVEADARFDGLFVLRTNTKIAALQVLLPYRNLLAVEDAFK